MTNRVSSRCWNPRFSGQFWPFLPLKSAERERDCRCRMHSQKYARPYCRLLHSQCHWASLDRFKPMKYRHSIHTFSG
jgi:hypothetical protein